MKKIIIGGIVYSLFIFITVTSLICCYKTNNLDLYEFIFMLFGGMFCGEKLSKLIDWLGDK